MKKMITAGAAQGSILVPYLWNASYDGILHMEMPEGAFLAIRRRNWGGCTKV